MKIDEEYCNIIEKSRTDIIERNIQNKEYLKSVN